MTERTTVVVYVCTYRRNALLATCLDALLAASRAATDVADVGVVVVDDNDDGRAEAVVSDAEDGFPLGLHYVHVGKGNISLARNAGLDAGAARAEWVAMTDDDCRPDEQWITELFRAQRRHDADAVTGPLLITAPANGPKWLKEQPFFAIDLEQDGTAQVAYTNNSMIRSAFLVAHPDVRFEPSLGIAGGEDMVFYHRARDAGLRIVYTPKAVVTSIDDLSRATYLRQLQYFTWLGNTEATTNRQLRRAGAVRLVARGTRRLLAAVARPLRRLSSREAPQWRYAFALCASGGGMIIGAVGLKLNHPGPR